MITAPERYLERFVEAGADYVTFHYEATDNIEECINLIRKAGAKVGESIKPKTPVEALEPILDKIDLVLVMSVEPGFGGQSFIEGSTDKVRALRRMIDSKGLDVMIEIDGGVSRHNAGELYEAGCDALVAGSAVFKAADPEEEIVAILNA
jgi:ribulose-phosphate 3-epimerase